MKSPSASPPDDEGAPSRPSTLWQRIVQGQLWRSVVRHGYPDRPRNQLLVIASNVFLHLHPTRVKRHGLRLRHSWCMGGISAFLFGVLTVTGLLLMLYYTPDTRRAYADMKDLEFVVPFGKLLRNAHRWGAHAMVITVIAHMTRVFLTGSYRPPREFNWVVGVGLLVTTLLLSFTGYLLPWDQLAMWAITVGTNMADAAPLVGASGPLHEVLGVTHRNDLRFALLGGTMVDQSALLRFYVAHCIGLPLVAVALMAIHFWRVRKDGGIAGPLPRL